MNKVAIYLRKSRADEEAEKQGAGETLSKHRKILLKVAREQNLNIIKIREEIVSGESMVHRPEMLELLKEIENKIYDAVLVMDVDRLGRGNMQEQGLILDTFKKSNTKIITPRKTYDLKDEWDEEYSEFEAFMARKELKLINRRLQRGRIRSIEEGNYISPRPPFGYKIEEGKNYRSLIPHSEQAPIVKLIFDLYTNKNMGGSRIANELNKLGYKTYTGKNWGSNHVIHLIKNPIYNGKIVWKKKDIKKSTRPGQIKESRERPRSEWIISEGKHHALVSDKIFNKAQMILKNKSHVPYKIKGNISNPLAGIIKCSICNKNMVLRPYKNKDSQIMCYGSCGNKSSKLKYVEKSILDSLESWLKQYQEKWENKNIVKSDDGIEIYNKALNKLEKELDQTIKQKNNLHDLLEKEIYDVDTYMERYNLISNKIDELKSNIKSTNISIKQSHEQLIDKRDIIPRVKHVLALYDELDDAEQKNILLKSVIEYAIYYKKKSWRNDKFELNLKPKIYTPNC
ncbi:recombinase family protein [Senegalia massiliensis]|uniref:Recombinase family protein n=1 Tax=Senegalia massiliensis TaxID=1720316 RepID=A0A845R297_9CLOT|nr:recombinase family protein [Senegalia massiliensis]NBI06703.1 recombinase family protein [Senegalia massiliensis]